MSRRISFTVTDEEYAEILLYLSVKRGFSNPSSLARCALFTYVKRFPLRPPLREQEVTKIDDDPVHIVRSEPERETENPVVCEIKEEVADAGGSSSGCSVSIDIPVSAAPEKESDAELTGYGKGIEINGIPIESCYYCGMPAMEKEHVIPQSILRNMADVGVREILLGRKHLVRACRECNCLLGATYQRTLMERKAYLKSRLRERYHSVLKMKNWTEEELWKLGPTLRSHVETAIRLKSLIQWRLAW